MLRKKVGLDNPTDTNKEHFRHYGKKPQFPWCVECVGATGCYPDGRGPQFLDQDCYSGPIKEKTEK